MSWSGGKDSALALYELQRAGQYRIAALVTTVTETYDRISMHGVRRVLLEQQCASIGAPLEPVFITNRATNDEYERQMRAVLEKYKGQGVQTVAFGDIFLADLRSYRERNLAQLGMRGLFPIWQRNTRELADTFVKLGFEAVTTCVDSQVLGREFVGRKYDAQFIGDLPPAVDPCGENGEFHSFAYKGPIFRTPIACRTGETVLRDARYYFCDLLPQIVPS